MTRLLDSTLIEFLGKVLRAKWVQIKREEKRLGHPVPAHHLLSWEHLDDRNKEIDRQLAIAIHQALLEAGCVIHPLLDIVQARNYIEMAVKHYGKAPQWFVSYLDGLYIRLGDNWREVPLDELGTLMSLSDVSSGWVPLLQAEQTIYTLLDRLGRDTTGIYV